MSLGTLKIGINNVRTVSGIWRAAVGVNYGATGSKVQGSVPCRDNIFCHLFSETFRTVSEGKPACWPTRNVGLASEVKEAGA
jgi:hypothetical protein